MKEAHGGGHTEIRTSPSGGGGHRDVILLPLKKLVRGLLSMYCRVYGYAQIKKKKKELRQ